VSCKARDADGTPTAALTDRRIQAGAHCTPSARFADVKARVRPYRSSATQSR
jgi:hypothetical protein